MNKVLLWGAGERSRKFIEQMECEMLLSVIVPVYNTEEYLPKCIESILSQSLPEFEVLLVDDGSTDRSLEICRIYEKKDVRIRVIAQTHQGPFFARKRGINEALGDYVTFADADDFIAAEAYSLALDDMLRKIDVISFGIYRYYGEQKVRWVHENMPQGVYNREQIKNEIFPLMLWDEKRDAFGIDPAFWNKFYRRSLVRDVFNKFQNIPFHYGEDVAVIYPLLEKAETIAIHYEAYYYHRQRKNGTVAPYIADKKFLDNLYLLYRHLCGCFEENEMFQRQVVLFYTYSVQLVKSNYGIYRKSLDVIFPFDRVDKDAKVIVYGAGNIGRTYIKQLSKLKYCEVVLWVDKNYKEMEKSIKSPNEITDTAFDKIVIAIEDPEIRRSVRQYLIGIGVRADTIV